MRILLSAFAFLIGSVSFASGLTAEQSEALKKSVEVVKAWAAEKSVVDAIKAVNSKPLAEYQGMTQDTWKGLPILDPKVKYFSKVSFIGDLKAKKTDAVVEIFANAADGTKVGFLSKTSSWSHKGKPKHDDPMAGKVWQGNVEVDESTGQQQIQVSVPVLDGGKAIGSLVVGFAVTKLK